MKTDYVDWLSEEIVERKRRNERYSERAFAKSIGLSPGFLKHILQRKKNLSPKRALEVARRLQWSEFRAEAFLQSLKLRSRTESQTDGRRILDQETFSEISDWYGFAIVELLAIKSYKTTSGIARALGISVLESEHMLRKLCSAGLVKKGPGGFEKTAPEYEMPSISAGALRKFHAQTLAKAAEAIEGQKFAERELRALTLAFNADRLDEARLEIAKFMKKFEKRFAGGRKDSVYQMNLVFYRIDKEG